MINADLIRMYTYDILRVILQYKILNLIQFMYKILLLLKICRRYKNIRNIRYTIDINNII